MSFSLMSLKEPFLSFYTAANRNISHYKECFVKQKCSGYHRSTKILLLMTCIMFVYFWIFNNKNVIYTIIQWCFSGFRSAPGSEFSSSIHELWSGCRRRWRRVESWFSQRDAQTGWWGEGQESWRKRGKRCCELLSLIWGCEQLLSLQ